MFVSFSRITKFAWQDFWRNFWLSGVTILIIILSLFSVSILVVLNVLAETSIQAIKEKVDISVYFKPEVKEAEVKSFKNTFLVRPEVKEIKYISAENALAEFRKRHQDNPLILEALEELEENPLGATLIIKAKSSEDYGVLLTYLSNPQYQNLIQEKDYHEHRQIIGTLNQIADKISRLGLIISTIFILIAILVVFNTIRLNIYTHRREARTMRLVGATSWFIRSPYLLEAVFYGVLAWAVNLVIIFLLVRGIQPYVVGFLGEYEISLMGYLKAHFLEIFGLELILVVLLCMISSVTAIRRYLKT
jgi:cell division transport system permease protein